MSKLQESQLRPQRRSAGRWRLSFPASDSLCILPPCIQSSRVHLLRLPRHKRDRLILFPRTRWPMGTWLYQLWSGDSHRVQALIGSKFQFRGEAPYRGGGTNIMVLTLSAGIWRQIDAGDQYCAQCWSCSRGLDVTPTGAVMEMAVSGILKRVDFDQRVIYILAKPDDYRSGMTF